jgi:hypothetical protein
MLPNNWWYVSEREHHENYIRREKQAIKNAQANLQWHKDMLAYLRRLEAYEAAKARWELRQAQGVRQAPFLTPGQTAPPHPMPRYF